MYQVKRDNRHLAEDLRQRLVAARVPLWETLDVDHFHHLCLRLAHNFIIPIPKATTDADLYTRQLPIVLLQATRATRARYDAIIGDWAQDFDPGWWKPLQALLRDREHGIWYLFFDDTQRLYDHPLHLPIDVPPYQLTKNCRTTRHIHTQIVQFYRPGEGALPPVAHGPQGVRSPGTPVMSSKSRCSRQ